MIKIGDWARITITDEIVKVHHVWEGLVYYFTGYALVHVVEERVEKLPIKFKAFDIVMDYAGNWDCYRNTKSIGKIHFVCIEEGTQFFTGYKVPHESFVIKYCNTIPQSEAWLELQYAILIAKTRGLV